MGSRDFGRCPLASRVPAALWPVSEKPVLERLLSHLADEGIEKVAICFSGEDAPLVESIRVDGRLELTFLDEPLPVGTAGSLRSAANDRTDALLLVFPGNIVCPPSIEVLIEAHREGCSDVTVMLNPGGSDDSSAGQASGIYVCSPSVLEHIPDAGYFDIKEGLIPELLQAGKRVHAARLPQHAGNFRDRQGYLHAIADHLEPGPVLDADLGSGEGTGPPGVRIAASARVDPGARLCGPVVVMDGARVSSGAVVLGPAVLGRNATVGKDSVVINSVLWDAACVDSDCEIRRCVIDRDAVVRSGAVVEDKSIPFKSAGILEHLAHRTRAISINSGLRLRREVQPLLNGISKELPSWIRSDRKTVLSYLASSLVITAFIWSYWPGLTELWSLWMRSDEYSSGLLVPLLSVYVLWSRRHALAQCRIRPSVWGLLAFAGAQAVRLFGLFFMYSSAERASIVLGIAALVLLLFGWQFFRKVFPLLLFLCLMLPWPNLIQYHVGLHLQRWATSSAVFCLEMVGCGIVQEGNIIHIGDASVEVAYACNGLRMITAFIVISGFVVLLVERARWEKLIILISSLPIALFCNTVRLTVTAMALTRLSGQFWDDVFHDFGGYAMMPLALAAVVGELWLLTKLTAVPDAEEQIVIARQNG
ncbi:MAG: exosortase [Phycisphaerales bacterium]|nr:MAG: exosortase [Phycisphaerales bacterium]